MRGWKTIFHANGKDRRKAGVGIPTSGKKQNKQNKTKKKNIDAKFSTKFSPTESNEIVKRSYTKTIWDSSHLHKDGST